MIRSQFSGPLAHLEPADERTDRIRQLGRDRPEVIPVLRQALAHRISLLCGRCEVVQYCHGVRILWAERSRIIVSVHSRAGKPEDVVVAPLQLRRVCRPGGGEIRVIHVRRQVRRCNEHLSKR